MKKTKKKKHPSNNLKSIREQEGLSITALSKLADVSTKVISETERSMREPRPEIKYKIINALNEKNGFEKYSFKDIFPNHDP